MAKRTKKTQVSDTVTETSEAIMLMAQELVAAEAVDSVDPLLNEVIADEIEAEAVAELQALEEADEVSEPQATNANTKSFEELVAEITPEERLQAVKAMTAAIDERAAFEAAQGNDNIQKNFVKARNAFCLPSAGAVLLACSVDEAFVNRVVQDGKRYNVYAMGKLADLTAALNGGTITNSINFAIMRSLFAFKRAGIAFTGDMAKAAASDKIRIADKAITAILTRHTVSAVTAPTQASSTMQALETLGIVRREGSHKNPTFTLTDHPAVAKLEEVMAKAA